MVNMVKFNKEFLSMGMLCKILIIFTLTSKKYFVKNLLFLSYQIIHPIVHAFRWNVAVKSIRRQENSFIYDSKGNKHGEIIDSSYEIPMLLDEAKTMFSVGEYHDNIVNLQGMTARVEEGILGKVCRPYQRC